MLRVDWLTGRDWLGAYYFFNPSAHFSIPFSLSLTELHPNRVRCAIFYEKLMYILRDIFRIHELTP